MKPKVSGRAKKSVGKTAGEVLPKKKRNPVLAKETLLQSAKDIFNSKTYFSTDTNEIARNAGYAPATFYRYFQDKLDVFLALYQNWHEQQRIGVLQLIEEHQDSNIFIAKLAPLIISFYRDWRGFRASVRCLAAIDEKVHAFRLARREELIKLVNYVCRVYGLPAKSVADTLCMLLTLERIGDALADGEFTHFKVSNDEAINRIAQLFLEFLSD